jgi:alpha-L-rhamnosidase
VGVENLRCESLQNPLGIERLQPHFSWELASGEPDVSQSSYRIIVASSPEKLEADQGDIWDSGRVKSEQTAHIVYEGLPLESAHCYYWKVKAGIKQGKDTPWSSTACWSTGLLHTSDWQAQWIGDQPDLAQKAYAEYVFKHRDEDIFDKKFIDNPPVKPSPLLRKTFQTKDSIKNAYLYVSALGYYEMQINGERIGDHRLAPEWTDYDKRVQYQTYEVSEQIKQGENVLSAMLADGWYLGELAPVRWFSAIPHRGFYGDDRRLIAQLHLSYTDGSTQIIPTDGSWKINTDGYILKADNFDGQTIDARKRIPGWNLPGFDDASWANVYVDHTVDKHLEAQKNEPVRIHQTVKPVDVKPWKDKYIVDFGQNLTGCCALKIKGKPGQTICLRHAEWLEEDGGIYTGSLEYAISTDLFILSGGDDYFEPQFTYHGFQYVEISGLTEAPDAAMITALAISSDPEESGTFECSNPKLNKLYRNICWSQRNNMTSVPTDCPSRDERAGFTGDAQIFFQTSVFNMYMPAFWSKFIQDMRESVTPDGQFTDTAPSMMDDHFRRIENGGPGWADAGVMIPWMFYVNYGDKHILQEHYDAMKTFIESIHAKSPDLRRRGGHPNDWLNAETIYNPPDNYDNTHGKMPDNLFATAFFFNSTYLLAKIADVLGYKDDASKYKELSEQIKAFFLTTFVHPDGSIEGHVQGAYAISLYLDLVPDSLRSKAFDNLLACIEAYDYRISTGMIATPMMMSELVRNGRTDVAYRLLESERFPAWLYAVNQGSTTLWERWDGYAAGRGIHPSYMNSFDHYAFGAVGEWMYRHILGINPDANYPGYEHFTIHPRPGGTLTWAKGSYHSIRGTIASSWKLEAGKFTLSVTIPANTTATVVLPTTNPKQDTSMELGSGDYRFEVSELPLKQE